MIIVSLITVIWGQIYIINNQQMIDMSLDPPANMNPNHWILNSGFQDLDLSIYESNWNNAFAEFGFTIGDCND